MKSIRVADRHISTLDAVVTNSANRDGVEPEYTAKTRTAALDRILVLYFAAVIDGRIKDG